MPIQSVNPATGVVLRSYQPLVKKALTGKIVAAHHAFGRYRATTVEQRAMWMKKLAGILEHEMEDLATLLTSETGKTIRASRQEILDCAACCRYFAENAAQLPGNHEIPMELNTCAVRWQALGVVLAVMPAGSPFWQVFRFLAPALLTGNTVLLKHAATLPQCAMEMELLVLRAGFPREVFQTLLIDPKHMDGLLGDARLAAVVVTDTVLTGQGLRAKAKFQMKATATERGSNPLLVMPSANLFAAIQAAVTARCVDNGESAAAATRFVVHESVYEDFALLLSAAMEDVKVGNPAKDETVVGPLSSKQVVSEMEAKIAAAVAAGGRLLTGGQRMVGVGNFFEPTVIADVPRRAKVASAPIFGPVAMLFKVASLSEAAAVANESVCGFGASVWTQDVEEQQDLALQLECGSVFVNTPVVGDPLLALLCGGDTRSGSELCTTMLREFMVAKTLVIAEPMPEQEMNFDLELAKMEATPLPGEEVKLPAPVFAGVDEDFFSGEELPEDVYVPASVTYAQRAVAPVTVEQDDEELCVVGAGAILASARLAKGSVAAAPVIAAPVVVVSGAAAPAVAPVAGTAPVVEAAVAAAPLSFAQMFERALQNRPAAA